MMNFDPNLGGVGIGISVRPAVPVAYGSHLGQNWSNLCPFASGGGGGGPAPGLPLNMAPRSWVGCQFVGIAERWTRNNGFTPQ